MGSSSAAQIVRTKSTEGFTPPDWSSCCWPHTYLEVVPVVPLLVGVGGGEVEDVVVARAGGADVELVLLGGEQPRLLLERGLRLEEAAHVLLAAARLVLGRLGLVAHRLRLRLLAEVDALRAVQLQRKGDSNFPIGL